MLIFNIVGNVSFITNSLRHIDLNLIKVYTSEILYLIHTIVNIIQAMFCIAPYFDTDTILRATHFTCVSLILFGIAFVGHVIWREERRSRQKSRAFSYFACVDVSWRQSGRSGWYGLQVLTCDAHNKRWWRWLYFLLTTWESELRFFWNIFSCFKSISMKNVFMEVKTKKKICIRIHFLENKKFPSRFYTAA